MRDFGYRLRYNIPPPVRKLKRRIAMEQLESVLRSLTSEDRVLLIRLLRILKDSEDSLSLPPSSDQKDREATR